MTSKGSSPLSSSLSRISVLCLRVWSLGSLEARACTDTRPECTYDDVVVVVVDDDDDDDG